MDRLVDYFAVCGLPATPELLDSSRALEAERARDIMDIAVVFGNDEPPDGYMTIMHTPNGNAARFDQMQMSGLESKSANVYLAYRRREKDEHGPAISAIEVIYKSKGEVAPPGFELIEYTESGKSASIVTSSSKGVFLAIRRQDASEKSEKRRLTDNNMGSAVSHYQEEEEGGGEDASEEDDEDDDDGGFGLEAAIQDVCVILVGRGEEPPEGFALIDKPLNTRNFSIKTCLAVRKGLSVGLCDVSLKPQVLDRFPSEDYKNFPLPKELVEMFTFPQGIRLKRATLQDSPPAVHFSYAMTGESAKCYANAVIFYEPLNTNDESDEQGNGSSTQNGGKDKAAVGINKFKVKTNTKSTKKNGGNATNGARKSKSSVENSNKKMVWVPKCICLISHYPFFKCFKQWLIQLYARCLSIKKVVNGEIDTDSSDCGVLESHISQLLLRTPVPLPPNPWFLNNAGIPIEISLSHFASPVVLKLPPRYGLPMLDCSFNNLLRCLDIDNVLTIFANLLLERKVLLRSRYCSLITECCECFLSTLFPLSWAGAYLPRITTQLLEYIGCPGALLVGCHDETVRNIPNCSNLAGGSHEKGSGVGSNGTSSSSSSSNQGAGYSTLRSSDVLSGNNLSTNDGYEVANNSSKEEDGLMYLVKQLNPEDLVIVDLDYNKVIQPRNPYSPDEVDEHCVTFENLPRSAGMILRKHLELVCKEAGFFPGEGLGDMGVDGLFELPSSISSSVLHPSMASPPSSPMRRSNKSSPNQSSSPLSPQQSPMGNQGIHLDAQFSSSTSALVSGATGGDGGDDDENALTTRSIHFAEDDEDDNEEEEEDQFLDPSKPSISYISSPSANISYIAYFDERVRSYFLTFMASVMDGYDNFLIDPKSDWEEQHTNSFDKQGFVSFAVNNLSQKQLKLSPKEPSKLSAKEMEKDREEVQVFKSFVEQVIQTQMFAVFEHARLEACDPRLLYFDDVVHFYNRDACLDQVKEILSGRLLLSSAGSKPFSLTNTSGRRGPTYEWNEHVEAMAKKKIMSSEWMSALKDQRMKYSSQQTLHDTQVKKDLSSSSKSESKSDLSGAEETVPKKKFPLRGWAAVKRVLSVGAFGKDLRDPLQFMTIPDEYGCNRVVVKLKPAILSTSITASQGSEGESGSGEIDGIWPKKLNKDKFDPKSPLYETIITDPSKKNKNMEVFSNECGADAAWIHDTRILLCVRTGSEIASEVKICKRPTNLVKLLKSSSLYLPPFPPSTPTAPSALSPSFSALQSTSEDQVERSTSSSMVKPVFLDLNANIKWGIVRQNRFEVFPKAVQDAIHYAIRFRQEEEQGLHTKLVGTIPVSAISREHSSTDDLKGVDSNISMNEEAKEEVVDGDMTAKSSSPKTILATESSVSKENTSLFENRSLSKEEISELKSLLERKGSLTTEETVRVQALMEQNKKSSLDVEEDLGTGSLLSHRIMSKEDRQNGNVFEDDEEDGVIEANKWRDRDGIVAEVSLDGKIIQFNGLNMQHYMIDMQNHVLFNTDDSSMVNVNVLSEQEYYSSIQALNPGHLVLPLKTSQGSMLLQYPQQIQEDIAARTAALATHVYGAWFFCLPAAMSHAAAHYGEGAAVRRVLWRGIGCLEQLKYHRNVQVDEAICRAILSSCRKGSDYGGVDLGPVASYILSLLKDKLNGGSPNVLTGGQYMHALASGFHAAKRLKQMNGSSPSSSSASSSNPPLAPCAPWLRRLEDMGRLVHRRALLQRAISNAHKLNSEEGTSGLGGLVLPRTSMTDADEILAASLSKSSADTANSPPNPSSRKTPSPSLPPAAPSTAPPSTPPSLPSNSGKVTQAAAVMDSTPLETTVVKKRKQPRCIVTEPKEGNTEFLEFEIVDLGLIEGLFPGDDLLVISPSNQRVRVKSPVGVKAGQYFRLQIPVSTKLPKRVHRFNIFMLYEDHPPLRMAAAAAPNGIIPSRALLDHPVIAHFKPPFAICYKPNYIAIHTVLQSPDMKASSSSSKQRNKDFPTQIDGKSLNEELGKISENEVTPSTPSGSNTISSTPKKDRNVSQAPPPTPGTAEAMRSSSNGSQSSSSSSNDDLDEEKVNKEIRRLARLATSEILQHRTCCYASSFTDPQAVLLNLYNIRREQMKLDQMNDDDSDILNLNDKDKSVSNADGGGGEGGSIGRSESRSRSYSSKDTERRSSYSVGSSSSRRDFESDPAYQNAFFTPTRRRSTSALFTSNSGSIKSPSSLSVSNSPSKSNVPSPINTNTDQYSKKAADSYTSPGTTIVVDAESNIINLDSNVGGGGGDEEAVGSLFDEKDFDTAYIEINNWLSLLGMTSDHTVVKQSQSSSKNDSKSSLSPNSVLGNILSKNRKERLCKSIVSNCEVRSLQGLLKLTREDIVKITDSVARLTKEDMVNNYQDEVMQSSVEELNTLTEIEKQKNIDFLNSLSSRSALSKGVVPSTLRVAMIWSGVPSPHADSEFVALNKKEIGIPSPQGADSGGGKTRRDPSQKSRGIFLDRLHDDEDSEENGESSTSPKESQNPDHQKLNPKIAMPLTDEQIMAHWICKLRYAEENGGAITCHETMLNYQPRLYFRVLEPYLDKEPQEGEEGWDGDTSSASGKSKSSSSSSSSKSSSAGGKKCERWKVRAWGSAKESMADDGFGSTSTSPKASSSPFSGDSSGTGGNKNSSKASVGDWSSLTESPSCLSPPVCGPLDLLLKDGGQLAQGMHMSTNTNTFPNSPTSFRDTPKVSSSSSNNNDSSVWPRDRSYVGSVAYLSPAKLREGLELAMGTYKTDSILQREALRNRYPELFWNLFWYSARFGLPLPLSEGPDDLTAQWVAVCGWDALETHRMAQRAVSRLIKASLQHSNAKDSKSLKPTDSLAGIFSEYAAMTSSSSSSSSSSSPFTLPRTPNNDIENVLCVPSDGGFARKQKLPKVSNSIQEEGEYIGMSSEHLEEVCLKCFNSFQRMLQEVQDSKSAASGSSSSGRQSPPPPLASLDAVSTRSRSANTIDLATCDEIIQLTITEILKHRKLSEGKSFNANLYRQIMRIVVSLTTTRNGLSTTNPVQKYAYTSTNYFASSSSSSSSVSVTDTSDRNKSQPNRSNKADLKNKSAIIADVTKPSSFDVLYSNVMTRLVEELVENGDESSFLSDIGIGRHVSDLSPLPQEIAIRNIFGHLF